MQISDEDLEEFREIYREEFGKEIDRAEALEMATRLILLYEIIMKRLPPEVEDEIRRRAEDRSRCETSRQDV